MGAEFKGEPPECMKLKIPSSMEEMYEEFARENHKTLISYLIKCSRQKQETVSQFQTEEQRLIWCRKAASNAATSMYLIAQLLSTQHPDEDNEVHEARIADLEIGYDHIMLHIVDYMSQIIYKQYLLVLDAKKEKEVSMLKGMYGED